MSAVIQFLVLKRDNQWVVKSSDLERLFSIQRESSRRGNPVCERQREGRQARRGTLPKIEIRIRKDLDIRRGFLPAREIRFARDQWDTGAGKISGDSWVEGA